MVDVSPVLAKDIEAASREFFTDEFRSLRFGSSEWMGDGAGAQRSKPVSKEAFQNLAHGLTPDGSTKVLPNADDPDRIAAWQLNFHGSKSVSALWAIAPPADRGRIEDAAYRSVTKSIRDFADEISDRPGLPRLTCAHFFAQASWDQSPDLRSTAFLLSYGIRESGSVCQLRSGEVPEKSIRRIYSRRLHYDVMRAIGAFDRDPSCDELRIQGVPQALVCKFYFSSKYDASAQAQSNMRLSKDACFERWAQLGDDVGWSATEAGIFLRECERRQHSDDRRGLTVDIKIHRMYSNPNNENGCYCAVKPKEDNHEHRHRH
jgi:hypothetical protein